MKFHISKTNIISYTLVLLSAIVLGSTFYFLYNIKVIEDWKLTLPKQDIHIGDHIVVESSYKKLRNVTGISTRYIMCKNKNGVSIRYELNQRTADRGQGKGGTGIDLIIRRDIPDLPAKCKIAVSIKYKVLPLREVPEYQETEEFTLYGERTQPISSSAESQAATQSNQPQAQPVQQMGIQDGSVSSSSSNDDTSATESQPVISQESSKPPEPVSTPAPVNERFLPDNIPLLGPLL